MRTATSPICSASVFMKQKREVRHLTKNTTQNNSVDGTSSFRNVNIDGNIVKPFNTLCKKDGSKSKKLVSGSPEPLRKTCS